MKRPPRQVRLDDDIEAEIKKIAEITSLPQIEVIRQLIKAGVFAGKDIGYQLPLPLRMKVLESERPKTSSNSTSASSADQQAEDKSNHGKKAKAA